VAEGATGRERRTVKEGPRSGRGIGRHSTGVRREGRAGRATWADPAPVVSSLVSKSGYITEDGTCCNIKNRCGLVEKRHTGGHGNTCSNQQGESRWRVNWCTFRGDQLLATPRTTNAKKTTSVGNDSLFKRMLRCLRALPEVPDLILQAVPAYA